MSRTVKVLEVLRLFEPGRTALRAAEVAERLGVSPATAYRCIADLEEAGLLERVANGDYVLGPAIVELDRQIRIHDPLIAAAGQVMKSLAERCGGAVLLSRLHGTKVLCVHEVRGRLAPPVSYERGRAMPLYRGATSKVILAHGGDALLARLIEHDAAALRKAGFATRLEALQQQLAPWRDAGVCRTSGEVDAGVTGWAAPLFHHKSLLGSLSVVTSDATPPADAGRIADQVLRAALRIEARLEDSTRTLPRP